mgnify:CR=1 FL=1
MVERHLQMCVAWAGGVDRILYFDQKTLIHCKLNCGLRRTMHGPGEIMEIAVRVLAVADRFVFAAPIHNRL